MRKTAYIASYSKSVESSLEFRNGLLTRNILSVILLFFHIFFDVDLFQCIDLPKIFIA